jgi:hypothetical protein
VRPIQKGATATSASPTFTLPAGTGTISKETTVPGMVSV